MQLELPESIQLQIPGHTSSISQDQDVTPVDIFMGKEVSIFDIEDGIEGEASEEEEEEALAMDLEDQVVDK